ncbi:MAG: LptF/LptG family permease [Planctomycetes bacterium]|nr:LptF/LptG family permease [Planctomycetota bacterium]
MPLLFYRYLLGDLLRVLALSTAVLVTVIAFGAAIKPLAADSLLSAAQTAKYIVLAIVPMLQFALPFSAGFAATTALHRMTTDNEIQAMAVGGVSYGRIFLPIVALGIVLTLVMVLLTQWVIPRFWGLLERTVAVDLPRMFQASIERGVPFELGNLQILADKLVVDPDPPDTDADIRLRLWRVAAAELGDDGTLATEVTARQAVVDIYHLPRRTYFKLRLTDTVGFNSRTGELIQTPELNPRRAIVLPSAFEDDPRFMTQGKLLWLRDHPDEYGPVIDDKRLLAESLGEVELRQRIDAQLRATGRLELVELGTARRRYLIHADRLDEQGFATDDGEPVEVLQLDGATAARQTRSERVQIDRAAGGTLAAPAFDLVLSNSEVTDLKAGDAPNRRARLTFPNLALSGLSAEDLSKLPSGQLLDRARTAAERRGPLRRYFLNLGDRLDALGRNIRGRLLKRYALSTTACLLLVLGAAMGMWLRESLPLVIYLWSFLPSILSIILISGGEQMIRDGQVTGGILVMWSGNAVLLGLFVLAGYRLSRH